MGHENMSDDPKVLAGIARALRTRIADARTRVGTLEEELKRVEAKLERLGGAPKEEPAEEH